MFAQVGSLFINGWHLSIFQEYWILMCVDNFEWGHPIVHMISHYQMGCYRRCKLFFISLLHIDDWLVRYEYIRWLVVLDGFIGWMISLVSHLVRWFHWLDGWLVRVSLVSWLVDCWLMVLFVWRLKTVQNRDGTWHQPYSDKCTSFSGPRQPCIKT